MKRLLWVTEYAPYPANRGDKLRTYHVLKRVAQHYRVSYVAFDPDEDAEIATPHLLEFCEQVVFIPTHERSVLQHLPGLITHTLLGRPLEHEFYWLKPLRDAMIRLDCELHFDLLQIEHTRMASYREALPNNPARKDVIILHNVSAQQYDRLWRLESSVTARLRKWLYTQQIRRWEPGYAAKFDRCIVMSDADASLFRQVKPDLRLDVIPNGVDTKAMDVLSPPAEAQPPTLIFVGSMDYLPCSDAAIYFTEQILPLVKEQIPNIRFLVVGRNPPPEVQALQSEHVIVTGTVPDVTPYYQQSHVAVVPLRAGGGTRLKIPEAMALGRPVVSTSVGCEGIDAQSGKHLLLRDDPRQFAEAIIALLNDCDLYANIRRAGRELVVSRYDWDAIAERTLKIYAELLPA